MLLSKAEKASYLCSGCSSANQQQDLVAIGQPADPMLPNVTAEATAGTDLLENTDLGHLEPHIPDLLDLPANFFDDLSSIDMYFSLFD